MPATIDPRLEPFLFIAEVTRAERFAGELFARKMGAAIPDFGSHLVAFYARGDAFVPASYLHLWTQGTIGLVGGGCTDGRVIRAMRPAEQEAVAQAGGLLLQTLRHCFDRFGPDLEAFFGYCGDERAKAVDLRAGFRETAVPLLLARYNRDLPEERRQALLAQAQAIGPF